MSMEITNNYGNYATGYAGIEQMETQAILIVWKNIMKNYCKLSFRK